MRTAAIVGAIVTGAMLSAVGATAASAQTATTATTVQLGSASRGISTLPVSNAGAAGSGHTPATVSPDGLPIKPIVDWLKNNASSVIPALKNALKSGFNAFKNWWNGLAGWIRTTLTAIGQMSLQEMFDQLWHYFFG